METATYGEETPPANAIEFDLVRSDASPRDVPIDNARRLVAQYIGQWLHI